MKLNLSSGFNMLSQGLSSAASAAQQANDRQWQLTMAAKENKFKVDSVNAQAELEEYVAQWNVNNSVAMQSDGYNFQAASDELQTGLQSLFDEKRSTWFDGNEDLADRFGEEVVTSYITQVHTTLLGNEAKNILARTKNKANNTIASLFERMDRGASPAGVWEGVVVSAEAYANAAMLSPQEKENYMTGLREQFNQGVVKNSLNQIIDESEFTAEDVDKIVNAIQKPESADLQTEWGKAAALIVQRMQYEPGLSPFSQDQVDALKKTAKARVLGNDKEKTQAATETASRIMTEGLEAEKNPSIIWTQVKSATQGMPVTRANAAIEAAKNVQEQWATKKGYELWQVHKDLDLVELRKQRADVDSGYTSLTVFDGVPEVKLTFLKMYDAQIKALEQKYEGLSDDQIKTSKNMQDLALAGWESGALSGKDAIAGMFELARGTAGIADDVYAIELSNKMVNKLPAKYKEGGSTALKALESIHFGLPMNDKGKLSNPEDATRESAYRQWALGAMADLFMDVAGNDMSTLEFGEKIEEIKQVFISGNLEILQSGEVIDKWRLFRDPTATDDALFKLDAFSSIKPLYADNDNNYEWVNPQIKQTYDAVSGQLSNELSERGIQISAAASPLMVGNEVYPIPVFQGKKDGKTAYFTFNRDEIFTSPNALDWTVYEKINTRAKFSKGTSAIDEFFDSYRKGK